METILAGEKLHFQPAIWPKVPLKKWTDTSIKEENSSSDGIDEMIVIAEMIVVIMISEIIFEIIKKIVEEKKVLTFSFLSYSNL